MANYPKRAQDPTNAALSAIQEALNVRDLDEPAPGVAPAVAPPAEARGDTRADSWRSGTWTRPAVEEDFFQASAETGTAEELIKARPPANDDRAAIGQVLQAIQRRPARTSYLVATAFMAAWVLGGIVLAGVYLPNLQALVGEESAGVPALIGLGALFMVPIIFFYILAHMVWRSQELRLIAQSMAEVAVRLAEPETMARDSIVNVGQAIRREVAAMGDGVERALARAAELEALVHNEVSALERAYNDNEVRIRGLLEDLATQRDTLVGQAEQVRSAITSVHVDLSQDIT
jgi:hypothetical protein